MTDVKADISSTASMSLNSAGSDDGSEPAVQHPMNPRVEAKIKALCQRTGLVMKQENGQRKYTNPALTGKPEKGTEIFIGKLPRDLFEDELYPVLESYGPVFELRMMLDFNGNNRGFCFVTYQTRNESQAALKGINNFEIRKGRLLGACQSVDNCRLFVGGIPKSKKRDEIMEEMKKVTEGVVDVIVYPSAADKSKNRGFSFVEYKDHKAAAMARRKLMPGRIQLWGHQIAVDWAEPEIEVDESVMETVKILYVRNLMLHTSEDTLEAAFAKVTGKGTIERVKKIRDYAFVHFNTRDNALKAMKELNNGMIDGALVEVVLAKPVDRDSYVRHSRASERKVIQAPQVPMLLAYGDTAAQSLAAAQAQNVYAGAPMYYQMYQPAMMQEGRQSALRKPRGAGGTRPLGGRTYLGQPMRASESSDWLSPSGAPGPMSVQEIREKPRDTTHPYAYANLERHAQPVESAHASAANPAAAQPQLFPTLGGNMQTEQLGVPSLPITFMPGWGQSHVLMPHNPSEWVYPQPDGNTQWMPMVFNP